jgi:hypothetical protein
LIIKPPLLFAILLLSLAPPTSVAFAESKPPARPNDRSFLNCNLVASETWVLRDALSAQDVEPMNLTIEATSQGQTCLDAQLTYRIRAQGGQILYENWYRARGIRVSSEARTPAQMRAALKKWVSTEPNNQIHRFLPNWQAGRVQPDEDAPRFTIAPGISRQVFLIIKTIGTPIHCFYQDIKSVQCVIYLNGAIVPFGRQEIPLRSPRDAQST